ncbi:CAP domain-containing protein [Streptomyces sp. NPDC101150]|uniref:CAP domain-containing protein n=1 Tax=Streptomyces sp. NPDC101150 TaxID=3366114 RepID=UPI003810BE62
MTKHRRKRQHRKITVAALAIGAVAVPSVAMACWNGQGDEAGQGHARRQGAAARHHHHWSGKNTWSPEPTATAKPKPKPKAPAPSKSPAPVRSAAPSKSPAPVKSFAPSPAASPAASKTAAPASTFATRILELVNSERSKAGCSPLTLNAELTKAAQAHSKDMADHSNMSHTGSDGSDPGERITRAGYSWSSYGENVAYGYSTPESVMKGWMESPGHKRNILDCSFKEIGVGLAQPNDYWTQDFGTAR